MKELMKKFRSPGPEFRGAPFWAWNAKLDKEELIRQAYGFRDREYLKLKIFQLPEISCVKEV